MGQTLTKQNIKFDRISVYKGIDEGWYVEVSYTVETAEGETILRGVTFEITNASEKTSLANYFTTITNKIKAK